MIAKNNVLIGQQHTWIGDATNQLGSNFVDQAISQGIETHHFDAETAARMPSVRISAILQVST
jgi:hypothetical protein